VPHMPRRLAPMGDLPPELQASKRDKKQGKPTVSEKPPPQQEEKDEKSLGMQKIDPNTYHMEPDEVFKRLFGVEPTKDEHIGQLTHPSRNQE
jgi:hypothetical protein